MYLYLPIRIFTFLHIIFLLEERDVCASPLAVDGRVKEYVFVPPSDTQTFA
jgi:hypothetical protein